MEDYCFVCGRWQKIVAFFRCRMCFDNWFEGKEDK